MTKEHRQLRHQLQAAVLKRGLSKDFRAVTTNKQIRAATRRIADVVLSGKDPRFAKGIDGQLLRVS